MQRAGVILKACTVCGKPSPESYCSKHTPKPWATSTRRERMGLSGGAWATIRRRVLARDQGCCYLCDQLGSDTVDHLIEVAAGGTSRTDNLASCHASCHARRHRDPDWASERIESALATLGRAADATPTPAPDPDRVRAPGPAGGVGRVGSSGPAGGV